MICRKQHNWAIMLRIVLCIDRSSSKKTNTIPELDHVKSKGNPTVRPGVKKQASIQDAEMTENEKKDQSKNNLGEMDINRTYFII
jgi:hypothetical protein